MARCDLWVHVFRIHFKSSAWESRLSLSEEEIDSKRLSYSRLLIDT